MQLYDQLISEFLNRPEVRRIAAAEDKTFWKTDSDRLMVLRSDMAFELGGERQPSVGATFMTTDPDLVPKTCVTLIGPDLKKMAAGKNHPYARLSFVRLNGEMTLQGDELYRAIRNLEFTRYHFYPEGFMLRVSVSHNKESVRVSRKALSGGISFAKVGNLMNLAFQKNPSVCAVHTIYISDPAFDFDGLQKMAAEGENITKTIDHIFKNSVMDCGACSLQKICEEVEGLKELHMGKSGTQHFDREGLQ